MKIRPAPGRAARHPGSFRRLSEAGETVSPSPYWRRLLANGDVEIVEAEKPAQPETHAVPAQDAARVEEDDHAQ